MLQSHGGALSFNTSNWVAFIVQYIKCIDFLTVTRDYSTEDIDLLEEYCNATYNAADDVDASRYCFRKRKHGHVTGVPNDVV